MRTFTLTYLVECKWPGRHFETIAAFDCEGPARGYADDCRQANPQFTYRFRRMTPQEMKPHTREE